MTYVYARVSTEQQAMYGHSLEAQTEKCLKYAAANGLILGEASNCGRPGVFVDGGESARKKSDLSMRPGGRAMLQVLQPGDHVVVTSPHRLFRNLKSSETQLTDWLDNRVYAHFTDVDVRLDSPNGRLVIQVLGAVAEWNSRIKGERVREAHAWKKLRLAGSMYSYNEHLSRRERPTGHSRKPAEQVPGDVHLFDQIVAEGIEKRLGNAEVQFSGTIRAYIRVSKADQTAGNQKQPIIDWLANQPQYAGARLEWYIDEGYSAYSKSFRHRPNGRRLMAEIQEGDLLIALRADRICRSMPDMARLIGDIQKAGAAAVVVDCGIRTDTAMGRLMLSLLAFVAQLESQELDVSSNSAVRASILRKGVHPTNLPDILIPKSKVKRRSGNGLACLLTDDEYMWIHMEWFLRVRQAQENKSPSCRYKLPGAHRITYELNVEMANRLGFPIPPRSTMGGFHRGEYTIADAIKETRKMQIDLGFSQRRAKLLKYLATKKKDSAYAMFISDGRCVLKYRTTERWINRCVQEGPLFLRAVQESHILRYAKMTAAKLVE